MQQATSAPLLTSEVAQILGISEASVRLWERLGRLHAVKSARGVRIFERAEVEQLARERTEKSAAVQAVAS
jgi:DNA-binding transcriptional MerR regulator